MRELTVGIIQLYNQAIRYSDPRLRDELLRSFPRKYLERIYMQLKGLSTSAKDPQRVKLANTTRLLIRDVSNLHRRDANYLSQVASSKEQLYMGAVVAGRAFGNEIKTIAAKYFPERKLAEDHYWDYCAGRKLCFATYAADGQSDLQLHQMMLNVSATEGKMATSTFVFYEQGKKATSPAIVAHASALQLNLVKSDLVLQFQSGSTSRKASQIAAGIEHLDMRAEERKLAVFVEDMLTVLHRLISAGANVPGRLSESGDNAADFSISASDIPGLKSEYPPGYKISGAIELASAVPSKRGKTKPRKVLRMIPITATNGDAVLFFKGMDPSAHGFSVTIGGVLFPLGDKLSNSFNVSNSWSGMIVTEPHVRLDDKLNKSTVMRKPQADAKRQDVLACQVSGLEVFNLDDYYVGKIAGSREFEQILSSYLLRKVEEHPKLNGVLSRLREIRNDHMLNLRELFGVSKERHLSQEQSIVIEILNKLHSGAVVQPTGRSVKALLPSRALNHSATAGYPKVTKEGVTACFVDSATNWWFRAIMSTSCMLAADFAPQENLAFDKQALVDVSPSTYELLEGLPIGIRGDGQTFAAAGFLPNPFALGLFAAKVNTHAETSDSPGRRKAMSALIVEKYMKTFKTLSNLPESSQVVKPTILDAITAKRTTEIVCGFGSDNSARSFARFFAGAHAKLLEEVDQSKRAQYIALTCRTHMGWFISVLSIDDDDGIFHVFYSSKPPSAAWYSLHNFAGSTASTKPILGGRLLCASSAHLTSPAVR